MLLHIVTKSFHDRVCLALTIGMPTFAKLLHELGRNSRTVISPPTLRTEMKHSK